MLKLSFLTLFIFITSYSLGSGIQFQSLSYNQAVEMAKKTNKLIFIDVFATWCGPCKHLSKNIFPDETLGTYMNSHFISIKLDGEIGDGSVLMERFDLDAFPTMLFIDKEGNLLKKIVGAVEATEIQLTAQYIIEPETNPIFKMEKRYKDGDRTQAFLQSYIWQLLEMDLDASDLSTEYINLFPKLTLADEKDFTIFYMASDDLNNTRVKDFLMNTEKYIKINPELSVKKFEMILKNILLDADGDEDYIRNVIDRIYPACVALFTDEDLTKEQVIDLLMEAMDEY